jgi:ribokinase
MIVVVGSVNLDLVATVDRLPQPGETVSARAFTSNHGGKGANQAVAASRLGGDVALVAAVGSDHESQELLETLAEEGVDVALVEVSRGSISGVALITVDDLGENTIVVDPGANGSLGLTTDSRTLIERADVVLLQLEVPIATVIEAATIARGTVVLNAAPAMVLPVELIQELDVLIVNEHERSVALESGGELAAPIIITTLGPAGVTVTTPLGTFEVEAPEVEVVDTTGAGDTFCGAFAEALDRGEDTVGAVAWATRAGALATMGMGARTAMPTRSEMRRWTEKTR